MAFITALALLSLLSGTVHGGTTVWSGSFDAYPTVATFDNCKREIPSYWFAVLLTLKLRVVGKPRYARLPCYVSYRVAQTGFPKSESTNGSVDFELVLSCY